MTKQRKLNLLLQEACRNGITSVVKVLLEAGASPNTPFALYCPISAGNVEVVKLLLEAGANPNSQGALYWANKKGYIEIVKLLEEYGKTYEERKIR